ncbi:MAG: putative rane protein [Clostridia bacterium]|nr:putative rane protein [Clostridia bacterium]
MYFLIFILLLLTLFVIMIFNKAAAITFKFDTIQDKLYLFVNWFDVTAKIQMSDYTPFLTVYLFKYKIYSKAIKNSGKKKKILDYYRSLAVDNSYADIYYNFNDPSSTGITSGIIRVLQAYFKGISIAQFPDFIPSKEYVSINAGTKLNIGKTILNYAKSKSLKA